MVLDECLAHPSGRGARPVSRWNGRCGGRAAPASAFFRFTKKGTGVFCRSSSSPTPARPSSASCRAASLRSYARKARGGPSAIGFEAYAIGGLSVGEPDRRHVRASWRGTTPCLPEDRPRYLMGAGTPQDLVESVARGDRSVRLRAARRGTPGTGSCSPARGPSILRMRGTRRTIGRRIRRAGVTPAGPVRGPISGTFFRPAKSTRLPLTRCITCTFTLTPSARIRDAIAFGRFESFRVAFHQSLSRRLHDS